MGSWSARQLAALGAVAATALLIVGFVLPGSPPSFDADSGKIVNFFHDHHTRILVSVVLVEAGAALLIGLIAQLAVLLRDAGQRALAAIVGIAGAVTIAILATCIGMLGGLSQLAVFRDDAGSLPALYRLTQFAFVGLSWAALVLAAAVALAAWNGVFPRWVAAANGILAVLLLLGGISVKADGALAAGTGFFSFLAGLALIVWVLHLSVLFWGRAQEAPAAVMSPTG
jgi:hypothetical protein